MHKVMIAEDDLLMADMLAEILAMSGEYEVCGIARTVDKAVELGRRHNPDLAILDIQLADGGLGMEIPLG
jgi:response regulator of citrate/malate metabolism